MNDSGIFVKAGEELVLLKATAYDSEDVLQSALADFPQVIAGQSTEDDRDTQPLVLVAREMGIPTTGLRLDHLFLDGDGVPVLVEVKRASDTRIRREVIGQMLDYAANAATNWSVSFLRETLGAQAGNAGQTTEEYLAAVAGDDLERYWKQVEANIAAGRIRMMFVADELPESLVRIIEFCNEQMSPAEVLGVEVRQYSAGDHIAYVPRVVGRTSEAVATKRISKGTRWTRETFLAEIDTERCTPAVRRVVHQLLEHVTEKGTKLAWGAGMSPGVGGWYNIAGRPTGCWALSLGDGTPPGPYLVLNFGDIVKHTTSAHLEGAASQWDAITAFKARLNEARANDWHKWPSIRLADMAEDPNQVEALFAGLDIVSAPPPPAATSTAAASTE